MAAPRTFPSLATLLPNPASQRPAPHLDLPSWDGVLAQVPLPVPHASWNKYLVGRFVHDVTPNVRAMFLSDAKRASVTIRYEDLEDAMIDTQLGLFRWPRGLLAILSEESDPQKAEKRTRLLYLRALQRNLPKQPPPLGVALPKDGPTLEELAIVNAEQANADALAPKWPERIVADGGPECREILLDSATSVMKPTHPKFGDLEAALHDWFCDPDREVKMSKSAVARNHGLKENTFTKAVNVAEKRHLWPACWKVGSVATQGSAPAQAAGQID